MLSPSSPYTRHLSVPKDTLGADAKVCSQDLSPIRMEVLIPSCQWLPVEFLLGVTLLKREVSCPRLHFLFQGATCTQPFSKLPFGRLRPLTVYPLHLLSPASLILLWGLLLRIFSREPQSPSLGKSDCRPKLYKKSHSCPCGVHTVVERHSICT